jgi:transposase
VKEKRLTDLPRKGVPRLLDAKQARLVIGLACSDAPEGRAEWTMQLLADKLVERKVVDSISDETVRRVLKKQTQALTKPAMVYPASRCSLCVADGGCAGLIC